MPEYNETPLHRNPPSCENSIMKFLPCTLLLFLIAWTAPLPAQDETTTETAETESAPAAEPGTATFRQYGFTIQPLEGQVGEMPATVAAFYLPPNDGFSPNINVQLQPFTGDLDAYIKLTKEQFDQMGWEIVSEEKKSDTKWVVEYRGPIGGSQLQWYAVAVLSDGKAYLTTATAPQSQWEEVSATLKEHVDGFALIQKATPASDHAELDDEPEQKSADGSQDVD